MSEVHHIPPKNHSFLIDVFKSVHDKNRNSKLLLVGTGNGQSNIREKVDNLGLSDSVIFLGNRGDVNRILQAMDVFLFPSLYEGLPLSDLNLPIDEWADVVLEKQSTIRKNTIDDIKKSGFDVKQNVVKLEEFYLNSVEE